MWLALNNIVTSRYYLQFEGMWFKSHMLACLAAFFMVCVSLSNSANLHRVRREIAEIKYSGEITV